MAKIIRAPCLEMEEKVTLFHYHLVSNFDELILKLNFIDARIILD